MSHRCLFPLLAGALLFGAEARAEPSPNLRSPLTLSLVGPPAVVPGKELVLTLEIRRPVPNATPLLLDIALPPGVALIEGRTRDKVVDARSHRLRRTIRLRATEVPGEDLVVTVDVRTPRMGARAEARYRFGRPEPKPPEVELGPELYGPGGIPLGRPVMLTPPGAPATPAVRPGPVPAPPPTVP